jgi:hypothetical protein
MSIRLAASVAAAALLCACSGPKSSTAGATATASAAVAVAPAPRAAAAGPANSAVARAGAPGEIPLDPAQRAELDAAVAKVPARERVRLRYALAAGDDGKVRLVVYDGEGLGKGGRHAGRPHEYIVFRVINSAKGEHYDPQQNTIVPALPPPPQRDSPITQ